MNYTTIRISTGCHDALLRFGRENNLCFSDALAELLTRFGEDVERRVLVNGREPNAPMVGRPAKTLEKQTGRMEGD